MLLPHKNHFSFIFSIFSMQFWICIYTFISICKLHLPFFLSSLKLISTIYQLSKAPRLTRFSVRMSFTASNNYNTEHISKAIINLVCLQYELLQSAWNTRAHFLKQVFFCCPSWQSLINSGSNLFKQSLFTNTHQPHLCPPSHCRKHLGCARNDTKHFVSILLSLALCYTVHVRR